MHIERIRIDRVFDAHARGAFSFDSGGAVVYGVALPGKVVPKAGTVLVVAFARPGDWASVLGWRDAAGGKVVLSHRWWSEVDTVYDLALPALAAGVVLGGAAGGVAALVAVVAAVVWLVAWIVRLNRRVRAALLNAPAPE